jgi:hypothetical protein
MRIFALLCESTASTHDEAESEAVVAAQRVWQGWRPDCLSRRSTETAEVDGRQISMTRLA